MPQAAAPSTSNFRSPTIKMEGLSFSVSPRRRMVSRITSCLLQSPVGGLPVVTARDGVNPKRPQMATHISSGLEEASASTYPRSFRRHISTSPGPGRFSNCPTGVYRSRNTWMASSAFSRSKPQYSIKESCSGGPMNFKSVSSSGTGPPSFSAA